MKMFRKNENWVKLSRHLKYDGLGYTIKKIISRVLWFNRNGNITKRDIPLVLIENPMIKGCQTGLKADILLIQSPPWDVQMPPLGIAYLSSYAKSKGFKPLVLDANIYLYNKANFEGKKWWHQNFYDQWIQEELFIAIKDFYRLEFDRLIDIILSVETEFIGFSVNFASRLFTIELAKRIKERDKSKIIILGGFGCITEHMRSLFPKEVFDIFVIKEGEEVLCEILDFHKKQKAFDQIPGIIINKNGVLSDYVCRQPIKDLDAVPFPTFEEFYLSLYHNNSLPLLMSRGCIGKCTFCNDHEMSAPFRFRSAQHVVNEIKSHIQNYRISDFSFKDLLCNGNPKELDLFCDMIIESGLIISWESQAIPKKDLTLDLLLKMKKSGCRTLIYGVESYSDKVLNRMGKFFTKEDVAKVLADTRRAGIRSLVNIIVGFPGETEQDFIDTCNFLKTQRRNIYSIGAVSSCLINNDTALERYPERFGLNLPHDANLRSGGWTDNSGNTMQLRTKRLKIISTLIKKLDLPFDCSNISLLEELSKSQSALGQKNPVVQDHLGELTHELLENKDKKAEELLIKGIDDGLMAFKGPEIVQFDITNMCNNNCLCCWNKSPLLPKNTKSSDWHNHQLPLELVRRVIRDLSKMGTKTLFFAGGGEPFMHPDFLTILEEAKLRGMKTVINTNFTLLDKEKIAKLVELKVDFIHASILAATPEIYALMHPNKSGDDFIKIKKLLSFFSNTKENKRSPGYRPHLNMYYVICNKNFHQIPQMFDLALEVKANSMEFVPVDIVPGGTDALLLNNRQRKSAIKSLKTQMRKFDKIQNKCSLPITFIEQADTFLKRMASGKATSGGYETLLMNKDMPACYVGWVFSRIGANGDVYPCLKADKIPVGNIYREPFETIWNGAKQQLFRKKTKAFDKNDHYFWNIGGKDNRQCGCLVSCDNVQVNLELGKKYQDWIKGHEKNI